ncbi:MAG: BCCT family transporter [Oscillibacter sp.]|nr:BCCT family transporter [Oscillibacter sp.]
MSKEVQTQEGKKQESFEETKKNIRWEVFIPGFVVFAIAALVGIFNNEALTKSSMSFFNWSLDSFGWLYQYVVIGSTILVAIITFSKLGNVRLGGKDAKPKIPFMTWFAMTLTGGVATGIVTWGVNEPLIYYGNVWGELDQLGIKPFTPEAAQFAMGRSFMNWTFLPYAIYALCGVLVAYLYYNKKQKLNVTATLRPLFGERITKGPLAAVIDTLSMLALGIGICGGLAMCITLVMTGLRGYGVSDSLPLFIGIGIVIVACFTFSSYVGMDRGLKVLGSLNAWFYYGLLILLLVTGPVLFIMRNSTAGLATWLQNFWLWGLDPIDIGGAALTRSWTLFDWACWIAYAPVTGIFLAMISRGRTIREFMIVNWILPSVFGFVWFAIWGNSALYMQMQGTADLVGALNQGGAVMALWVFLQNLPFGIGKLVVPFNLLIIIISFVTAADATLTNVGSMCVKNVPIGTEPPAKIKMLWGVVIGAVAIVMAAFGGGAQGVDGVKALATAGGFVVLFVFLLQIVSSIKVFFMEKIEE